MKALFDRGWTVENVAWQSSFNGDPVYRLYNPNAAGGDYYYTADLAEARKLVQLGWK